jgi:hypothetical protein
VITIIDFSVQPARTIFEKKVLTRTVSEIPHLYLKDALDALYGKSDEIDEVADSAAVKERWLKAPNLVQGDFEKGQKAPLGWDPLPKHVSWVRETAKNRIIRFAIPPDVAETTGVLYYSNYFLVEKGATYRFQCRWRTSGTAVKVFIKCYDEFPSKFRGKKSDSLDNRERREVYRSQQNLSGSAKQWNTHTQDFTPKHNQFTPRWGRVMLYAYYPAGTVEWDDVVVKQIIPAPKTAGKE